MGDGGSGGDPEGRAQDPDCLLGKMLRIDVDGGGLPASSSQGGGCAFTSTSNYTIPADNPFVGVTSLDTLDEIWSFGLRNPWRFAFDPANGNMWMGDVGQGSWEEVNFELSGDGGNNYGWRCYEGDHTYNTSGCGPASIYVAPVFEYDHSPSGGRSLTGGHVYRGTDFPDLVGHYVLADYISDNVWTLFRETNGTVTVLTHNISGNNNISTFGVGEDGEMYTANLSGPIYKVEDLNPLPLELSSFSGRAERDMNKLFWTTLAETNTAYFEIERSDQRNDFYSIGRVIAIENSQGKFNYHFDDKVPSVGNNYYRLKMVDQDQSSRYSPIINIKAGISFSINIFPNPNDGKFTLYINGKVLSDLHIQIYNSNGDLVLQELIDRNLRKDDFDLSGLVSGVYVFHVSSGLDVFTDKIIVR
jgi:hypothetical protein